VAVGIDVAEERKGLDLVALDGQRRVVASFGRLSVDDAAHLVLSELHPALVCIDAPSGWAHQGRSRMSERHLRRLGITAFCTGPDPGDHPFYRWMRVGFALFAALAPSYPLFRGDEPRVFPEATAALLAGRHRRREETKVGFRRQVLRSHHVDLSPLPNADRVDAALAALTGRLALEGTHCAVGDPLEGSILLPVAVLPTEPLRRPTTADPEISSSVDPS
jgi:predicted nuclease with RNAse H fold